MVKLEALLCHTVTPPNFFFFLGGGGGGELQQQVNSKMWTLIPLGYVTGMYLECYTLLQSKYVANKIMKHLWGKLYAFDADG